MENICEIRRVLHLLGYGLDTSSESMVLTDKKRNKEGFCKKRGNHYTFAFDWYDIEDNYDKCFVTVFEQDDSFTIGIHENFSDLKSSFTYDHNCSKDSTVIDFSIFDKSESNKGNILFNLCSSFFPKMKDYDFEDYKFFDLDNNLDPNVITGESTCLFENENGSEKYLKLIHSISDIEVYDDDERVFESDSFSNNINDFMKIICEKIVSNSNLRDNMRIKKVIFQYLIHFEMIMEMMEDCVYTNFDDLIKQITSKREMLTETKLFSANPDELSDKFDDLDYFEDELKEMHERHKIKLYD